MRFALSAGILVASFALAAPLFAQAPVVQTSGFGTPPPQAGVIEPAIPAVAPSGPSAGKSLSSADKANIATPPKPVAKPKPKIKVASAPVTHERVVAKNDPRPSVHPESGALIAEAISRYSAIVERGGWPILPANAVLKAGSVGDAVLALRSRLALEGDLAGEEADSPRFDPLLARAVKAFQARHGLSQTGLVSAPTLKALRVPAEARLHTLEESQKRLAARHFGFGARYVVVNIPSASVEAIAGGEVQHRHIAVVGKKDRPSPEVETRITNVNFNPTWTVPVSIIKRDIIPKMRDDPGYLAKSKIRIIGASGNEIDPHLIDWNTERAVAFTLRQDAGTGNSLGQVRIDMPNRESVYMHDTPSKRLFLRDDRFHSSGCVRVEGVRELADWLLDGMGGIWNKETIAAAIDAGKRKDVRLKDPVPVIWTYLTGFVTPDGQVHFRDDVYGLDDPAQVAARAASAKAEPRAKPASNALAGNSAETSHRPTHVSRKAVMLQRIDP